MQRADLHVHSKYSEHPSEWFLQRLGAGESYTEPEEIYRIAKHRGMRFVTITDHNRIEGALQLRAAHPEDCFTGCEVTTYFPEDRCKIHLLVFGLSEEQFSRIESVRENVYHLRDLLQSEGLAHAVAHATSPINNKLTLEHFEKLVLLFDVFEVVNGGRSRPTNQILLRTLISLTPETIARLYEKHGIDPVSRDAWRKGLIGGSNDHAGLFIGRTFTEAESDTPAQFLEAIRTRKTWGTGRHNDHRSLVFSLYRVAYDFSRAKSMPLPKGVLGHLNGLLFDRSPLTLTDRIRLKTIQRQSGNGGGDSTERLRQLLLDLGRWIRQDQDDAEDRLSLAWDRITELSDTLLGLALRSAGSELHRGDIEGLLRTISSTLPGAFLSVPFVSSLRYLHRNRPLNEELKRRFLASEEAGTRKVLWFTDTLEDMNGVSETLRNLGWVAHRNGYPVRLVTSLAKSGGRPDLPPELVDLPHIHELRLPLYESYVLRIPSILRALERIAVEEPDLVYLSTPGPVGLIGLLAARLLNVPCVGVYHTDFPMQAEAIADNEHLAFMLEGYTSWFYAMCDEIAVPTEEYIRILTERGFHPGKMRRFDRGIDLERFRPSADARARGRARHELGDGPVLLYAGRISRDKNLDHLFRISDRLRDREPGLRLVLAGHGPDLDRLREAHGANGGVRFTGRLEAPELAELYAAADLFVFPSETDTFGMAVLEAQASGLPAIVSTMGGPKEIVRDGVTGHVLPASDLGAWVERIERMLDARAHRPEEWRAMGARARRNVLERFDWDRFLTRITGEPRRGATPPDQPEDREASLEEVGR
ncbi:MAG: glycosyltransferase [Candidatus Eisenbacteria bacterium]|nr:glycosyltransferase [Candidatus Latescibacterota bacterium]MBD3303267.1 glycosyltransferase [Candidatus Eisenbacteria bacterium]